MAGCTSARLSSALFRIRQPGASPGAVQSIKQALENRLLRSVISLRQLRSRHSHRRRVGVFQRFLDWGCNRLGLECGSDCSPDLHSPGTQDAGGCGARRHPGELRLLAGPHAGAQSFLQRVQCNRLLAAAGLCARRGLIGPRAPRGLPSRVRRTIAAAGQRHPSRSRLLARSWTGIDPAPAALVHPRGCRRCSAASGTARFDPPPQPHQPL
jgi:hypothetical protein